MAGMTGRAPARRAAANAALSMAALTSTPSGPFRCSDPMMHAAAGRPLLASAGSRCRTTSDDHWWATSRMTSVAGSDANRVMASKVEMPPTASDRSRPPVTRHALTPTPKPSSSTVASCAASPEVATTPTRPAATTLANPMPMPSMIAVSQPGPMSSRPASRARRFSTTSSATLTPSLTSITSAPAPSALCASSAA